MGRRRGRANAHLRQIRGVCFVDLLDEVGPTLFQLLRDEQGNNLDDHRLPAKFQLAFRVEKGNLE